MNWDIEECIDILKWNAHQTGDDHNAMMVQRYQNEGKEWPGAPNAYRATNSWHAVEIIRKLQAQLRATETTVSNLKEQLKCQ